jgi:hypothetical protein
MSGLFLGADFWPNNSLSVPWNYSTIKIRSYSGDPSTLHGHINRYYRLVDKLVIYLFFA